jgi:hypothetical protein
VGGRAAALFLSGQVLMAHGDAKEGRLRLSKALKYAHSNMGNYHLVAQVCGAPICCHEVTETCAHSMQG